MFIVHLHSDVQYFDWSNINHSNVRLNNIKDMKDCTVQYAK